MILNIIVLSVAVLLLYLVIAYNRFIRFRNMVEEGWSGIDVQLKKRYDLIPALVNIIKGYVTHEKTLLEEITRKRSEGMNASTVKDQAIAENGLNQAIGRLFAVAENYPQLKSSDNFIHLQEELSEVEEDIEMARRYYNGTVKQMNIAVESFPGNLIAGVFGFKKADFFEFNVVSFRQVPKINFE